MALATGFGTHDTHDQPSATNRRAPEYITDEVHAEVDATPRDRQDRARRGDVQHGVCNSAAFRYSADYIGQHSQAHDRSDNVAAGEAERAAVKKLFGTKWPRMMDRALGDLDDQRRANERNDPPPPQHPSSAHTEPECTAQCQDRHHDRRPEQRQPGIKLLTALRRQRAPRGEIVRVEHSHRTGLGGCMSEQRKRTDGYERGNQRHLSA